MPLNHEKGERRKHEENADGEKKLQVVSIDESKLKGKIQQLGMLWRRVETCISASESQKLR